MNYHDYGLEAGKMTHPGHVLSEELAGGAAMEPFLGIYDCLSASIAARYSSNLFLSGFGFSASYYGLPDVGYVAWSDMVAAAWRIRQILPRHKLLVDVDDGYVDTHTACHVVRQLEGMGTAMVMLEDQARPRRCGHMDGKTLLPLSIYLEKLKAVLEARGEMCVLARTDASGEDIFRRVEAMSETSADVLLVDGIDSVETLLRVRRSTAKPLLFNQIAGGKSPQLSIQELRDLGVGLVQYSTPLLFAAQRAMTDSLDALVASGGVLPHNRRVGDIGLADSVSLLQVNVNRAAGSASGGSPFLGPAPARDGRTPADELPPGVEHDRRLRRKPPTADGLSDCLAMLEAHPRAVPRGAEQPQPLAASPAVASVE